MNINSTLFKKIILHSLKLSAIYLAIGLGLIALAYTDMFFIPKWHKLFILTDKIGDIFVALALITFLYNCFIYLCLLLEQTLKPSHEIIAFILSTIRTGSRILYVLVVLNTIITITNPPSSYLFITKSILNTIIIASIGWIVIQIINTVETVLYRQMVMLQTKDPVRTKAIYTKMRICRNVSTVLVVIITIAAILMSFNSIRNIGISLLASAGFLTAIIGLSAQKTLVSIFSGVQLLLSQTIKIGDVVAIETETGIVEEITFMYVTLRLVDQRRLVVPIHYFIEKPFENWSQGNNSLMSSLPFMVDFMMPIQILRTELDRILAETPLWDGCAKKLQVAKIDSNHVEIRIQVSATNAENLSDLRSLVREKLLAFMQKHYPNYLPTSRAASVNVPGSKEYL